MPGTPSTSASELKGIIEDLRTSIAWMDLVFANLSEAICIIDRSGSIAFVNDAFASLVGKYRILLLGTKVWDVLDVHTAAGKQLNDPTISRAWSAEHEYYLNGHYYLKNGSITELTAHYVPKIDQMILVIRDVTDEQRADQLLNEKVKELEQTKQDLEREQSKLQEATATDEAMLESIGDSVIATDADGRVMFMNPQAEKLFGITQQAAKGKLLFTVLPLHDEKGELIPEAERPLRQALSTGKKISSALTGHNYYYWHNEQHFAISVTISPLRLHGTTIGAIGIYRDVTREVEIDRAKTDFISLASHQLRTPLSAINWFSEMLLDGEAGKLDPEQQEFARHIVASSHRMTELVNALLNISRIESGRIMIAPQPTDLRAMLRDVIDDITIPLEERHHTLIISVHESLPKINLDPQLISQVYLNLLTNAIKYTPAGGEIAVFVSHSGNDVISQISDNGYGIPASQQNKLFQKFFRAENVLKMDTDGNGLGMYLVKAIIESSGGKIWFESEENKGTTFWFSVPIAGSNEPQNAVQIAQ